MDLERYINYLIGNRSTIPDFTLRKDALEIVKPKTEEPETEDSKLVGLNVMLKYVDKVLFDGHKEAFLKSRHEEGFIISLDRGVERNAIEHQYTLDEHLEFVKDFQYFKECNEEVQAEIIKNIQEWHNCHRFNKEALKSFYFSKYGNVLLFYGVIDDEIERLEQQSTPKPTTAGNDKTVKQFSDYLTCNEEDKPLLIEYLINTFSGKGESGKLYAIMICALEKNNLIAYTNVSNLHNSLRNMIAFSDIRGKRTLQDFLNKNLRSQNDVKYYTNKLKNTEIEVYSKGISEFKRDKMTSF